MGDFDKDKAFQALFGGMGLDTASLVRRALSLLHSEEEAERFGAITDIRGEGNNTEIDDELIRLLKEEIENGASEEKIEDIIFCLRTRSLEYRAGGILKPDVEKNTEVGTAIEGVAKPLNGKNQYLFFAAVAASFERRGSEEDAKDNDMMAMRALEKEGRAEKLAGVKRALEKRKEAKEMKAMVEKALRSDGLRGYPEDRERMLSRTNRI